MRPRESGTVQIVWRLASRSDETRRAANDESFICWISVVHISYSACCMNTYAYHLGIVRIYLAVRMSLHNCVIHGLTPDGHLIRRLSAVCVCRAASLSDILISVLLEGYLQSIHNQSMHKSPSAVALLLPSYLL
jgi:hypothetical protein